MLTVRSNHASMSKRHTKMSRALMLGFFYPQHGKKNILVKVKPVRFIKRGVSENGPYFTFELDNNRIRTYNLDKIVPRLG